MKIQKKIICGGLEAAFLKSGITHTIFKDTHHVLFSMKVLEKILTIVMVVWEIAELLAVPALIVVIGILNDFDFIYYVSIIGGYILLFLLIERIAFISEKIFDKKFIRFRKDNCPNML